MSDKVKKNVRGVGRSMSSSATKDETVRISSNRSRIFWWYWAATTTSSIGSGVTAVALPLIAVITLDVSPIHVGFLSAASYIPWIILGLPAGVIVQRIPLRRSQIATDLVRGVALASVPIAWVLELLSFPQLIIVALAVGSCSVIFDVANATYLPSIVEPDELTRRNSLLSATWTSTQIAGPALGGLLVQAVGAALSLVADSLTFFISAAVLSRLPIVPRPQTPKSEKMLKSIAVGWRYVIHHPVLNPTMWVATTTNFVGGGLTPLLPLYLVRTLGLPPATVGLLLATEAVGGLIGAVITPRLERRFGSARISMIMAVLGALCLLAVPLGNGAGAYVALGLGLAGFNIGVSVGSILTRTFRQVATPPDLLSRVSATVRFVSWGAIPIGSIVAGSVASAMGTWPALVVFCVAALATPAIYIFSELRKLRDFTDGSPLVSATDSGASSGS